MSKSNLHSEYLMRENDQWLLDVTARLAIRDAEMFLQRKLAYNFWNSELYGRWRSTWKCTFSAWTSMSLFNLEKSSEDLSVVLASQGESTVVHMILKQQSFRFIGNTCQLRHHLLWVVSLPLMNIQFWDSFNWFLSTPGGNIWILFSSWSLTASVCWLVLSRGFEDVFLLMLLVHTLPVLNYKLPWKWFYSIYRLYCCVNVVSLISPQWDN